MISPRPVNNRQWHRVTLTANGSGQAFYLDSDIRLGMAASPTILNDDPKNFVGGGVFPADTSTAKWVNAPGDTTKDRTSYFTGQIADVIYYDQYLTPDQLTPYSRPAPVTGSISSQLTSGLCIDDAGNSTTNGNKIVIWDCNGGPAQQWTITPNSTNPLGNSIIDHKCMTVSGGGTADGTPIVLEDCDGSPSQEWRAQSFGQLWNPYSNKCLTDPGSSTTLSTQLVISNCDLGDEQNWHLP